MKNLIDKTFSLREKLGIEGAIVGLLVIGGSLAFHYVEGRRYLDSLYFTVITLTGVGYGDFTPHSDIGKVITIIFAFFAIPLFVITLGLILDERMARALKRKMK